jgi:hypothetical protein
MSNNKDWRGNRSFYIQNHRKKEAEISKHELYSTHPNSVRAFLNYRKFDPQKMYMWECANGTGNISRVLKEYGFQFFASDKYDYGTTDHLLDFLTCQFTPDERINCVMTNPPYKYAEEFVWKFFDIYEKVDAKLILYLKLTFLEGKKRFKLFQRYPIKKVYLHSSRQGCSPQGDFDFNNGGAVAYGWYEWDTGFTGPTTLEWLPPN